MVGAFNDHPNSNMVDDDSSESSSEDSDEEMVRLSKHTASLAIDYGSIMTPPPSPPAFDEETRPCRCPFDCSNPAIVGDIFCEMCTHERCACDTRKCCPIFPTFDASESETLCVPCDESDEL